MSASILDRVAFLHCLFLNTFAKVKGSEPCHNEGVGTMLGCDNLRNALIDLSDADDDEVVNVDAIVVAVNVVVVIVVKDVFVVRVVQILNNQRQRTGSKKKKEKKSIFWQPAIPGKWKGRPTTTRSSPSRSASAAFVCHRLSNFIFFDDL